MSKEKQEIALIGFLNDSYVLGKCIELVPESYFENDTYRIIYKCLKSYYNQYSSMPTVESLAVIVSDECLRCNTDSSVVIDTLKKMYEAVPPDPEFAISQIEEFIRRNRLELTLNKLVHTIKTEDGLNLTKISEALVADMDVTMASKQMVYNLSDIEKVSAIREEALGSMDSPLLIKFFIDGVNQKMQYKALPPGTINMVSAPPGCGKTTLMINQGMYTAMQGFKVLHIFLGDMSKYDGLLRYLSNKTGVDTNRLVDLSAEELSKFITKNNLDGSLSNIYIASYAQCELTSTQLIEEINVMQKNNRVHFDLIIVDYDENISKDDEDNIYESGGLIYNKLGLYAVANKSVVFIVAQPKPQYWNQEVIPLESASESSKKQKIIDTMITMGKPHRASKVGTLFIAKNRRGEVGGQLHISINGANTRIEHISQEEYANILNSEDYNKGSK